MIFLALDFGQKRLGLAFCDPQEKFVFPHGTLTRRPNDNRGDIAAVLQVVKAREVEAVVLGIPGGSSQSEKTAQQARRFAQSLQIEAEKSGIVLPVYEQDERFSTALAARVFQEGGVCARRAREEGRIDAAAAAAFLETFLDSRKDNNRTESANWDDFSE